MYTFLEILGASAVSLVTALIWVVRLGAKVDALETRLKECQEARDVCKEHIRLSQNDMVGRLDGIRDDLSEVKGELKVLLKVINGKNGTL